MTGWQTDCWVVAGVWLLLLGELVQKKGAVSEILFLLWPPVVCVEDADLSANVANLPQSGSEMQSAIWTGNRERSASLPVEDGRSLSQFHCHLESVCSVHPSLPQPLVKGVADHSLARLVTNLANVSIATDINLM